MTRLSGRHSRLWCALLAAAFLAAWSSGAWAYFFDYGAGGRPTGMGRAFVAVADDATTVDWNPAGLATLNRYELTTMYASLFAGLQERLYTGQSDQLGYDFVALAAPIDPTIGYFGASWSEFYSTFYRENTFNFGYARDLSRWGQTVHLGATFKILNWAVDSNDYTEALSKTGYTMDLGLLYPLPKNFMLGLCLQNAVPTNVGVTTYEEVPRNFKAGLSWRQDLQPLHAFVDEVLFSAEADNRNYSQGTNTYSFGVETWLFHHLAGVRAGVNSTEFTAGISGQYTFPQLNMTQLELDYSFSLPFYIEQSYGTHRFALTASWGQTQLPAPGGGAAAGAVSQAVPAVVQPKLEITPEDNLAAKRDKELAAERAAEEARLQQMLDNLRLEIKKAREEINQVNQAIRQGEIPPVQFEPGKAQYSKTSVQALKRFGVVFKKYPDVKVRLEGHTDAEGKADVNLKLSQRRVEVLKAYWQNSFQLNPDNFIPVGFGGTQPVAGNDTPEGRAANRRLEIKVLVPSGLNLPAVAGAESTTPEATSEPVRPEDIVKYEDIEKEREKLKVYQMQVNPKEVEELLNQQHRQEEGKPAPK